MVLAAFSKAYTKVFGSRNDRLLKAYRRRVEQVNALEGEMRPLGDAQLRERAMELHKAIVGGQRKMSEAVVEGLAIAREAMDRAVGIRNVFNPEHKFDPSRLPGEARELYAQTKAKMDATEPAAVPGGVEPIPGWMQVEIPTAIYEAVRALYPESRPPFRARPFDVQLIGGMVLSEGKVAEMRTGEGKTIVAPLACFLACLEGMQCAVVTVNDYLVQRDRDWVFPFYHQLGLTVGAIHPMHMQHPEAKRQAYGCNVVYGTNSEFGFDYLRDNMKLTAEEQVQKRRDFCIIDEADSILIDEARTPLIISGPAHDDAPRYGLADQVARHLIQKQKDWDAAEARVQAIQRKIKGLEGDIRNTRDKASIPGMKEEMRGLIEELPGVEAARDAITRYYEIEQDKKATHLTHEGVAEAQKVAGIGSFYVGTNMDFPHLLENSLRAHAAYQRDKDYVVRGDEVIIVDEFTGRLMIGRQWSDGLHQAVEAKEKVKIKQETQTLATVTIQNYAKLYKRLAGMTGTALTEATEFAEIYKLEVVAIPTNRPVIRTDRDDLIYLAQKDKWSAILDEIKRQHDVGRPVLVGTTSVEKSEMLSEMLTKRHGIKHSVLNARVDKAEQESLIVAHAGELGAVMIATNMAGRGTDIKLTPVDREALVRHWQVRNLLPKQAEAGMGDEELVGLAVRHLAAVAMGVKDRDMQGQSDEEVRLSLLRHWAGTETMVGPEKAAKMSAEACEKELDRADFSLHRLRVFRHVEEMGGLHIVGTERHESRRIDNQLRGRSGRQGDRGSSRFFIALDDELMKMFASKAMLTILSKLGMKEGDAIEHRMVTKSVERAQKKVEERNFQIRKNLLEYDEVMEHQRSSFYGTRQAVLEGREVSGLIFDYIESSVRSAVETYLAADYTLTQMAEWCRATLDVSIEPAKLRAADFNELEGIVRRAAAEESRQTIAITVGEYMSSEMAEEEWDLKSLSSWAMSRFSVDLPQARLKRMSEAEVHEALTAAAAEQIQKKDVSGLMKYLQPLYAEGQLSEWARNKFGISVSAEELSKMDAETATSHVLGKARQAYARREVVYPVEFAMEMTIMLAQQDRAGAAAQLAAWANQRYEMGWTAEMVMGMTGQELHDRLMAESQAWVHGKRLEEAVGRGMREHATAEAQAAWARQRFGQEAPAGFAEAAPEERKGMLMGMGRQLLRMELSQLERFVMLQILDTAWKDHLYAMDQLRDSVSLRGYAEKDPRIEYKREGANQFSQMQDTVRDRVTDLIFRAKLTAGPAAAQRRDVYSKQEARQDAASSVTSAASSAATAGTAEQRADLEAAERAGSVGMGGGGGPQGTRKQRRAAAARERGDEEKKKEHHFKERKHRR